VVAFILVSVVQDSECKQTLGAWTLLPYIPSFRRMFVGSLAFKGCMAWADVPRWYGQMTWAGMIKRFPHFGPRVALKTVG